MGWRTNTRSKKTTNVEEEQTYHSGAEGVLLQQVSKRLGSVQVLKEISFHIAVGECAVLVGRNGSGKSSLLRMLAGMILPNSGSMQSSFKGRTMLAIDGLPKLPFTAKEYLMTMGRIHGLRSAVLEQHIKQWSERLFLGAAIDQQLPLLSKGTLQKVNLIQSLLPGPGGLILLDEPLSGLDHAAQEAIVSLLQQWKEQGTTIITACHEPLIIERMADHVIVLQQGEILRHWRQSDLECIGEPDMRIQSLMKQAVELGQEDQIANVTGQPGVRSVHSSHIGKHGVVSHYEWMWDWRVSRSSADRIIGQIIASGGSIVSVQQDKSLIQMERLLEGKSPIQAIVDEKNTSSLDALSAACVAKEDAQ
ncbi:ATP-binding cassette domain-containing protein [Paenibacillus xylanexedens]|uniref:ATP-binding cassette domain-containing protein n=1 Tax=Paenibacillus xylanexedens TaxID=528191 RepID=UPI0016430386|nr:ABC transporter ATP-binding protein [Paenibacillus xylanexedens]